MQLLDVRYVVELDRATLGCGLDEQSAATEHAVNQAALVQDVGYPHQRDVLADLVEDSPARDEAPVRDGVGGGPPA